MSKHHSVLFLLALTACNAPGNDPAANSGASVLPDTSTSEPSNPPLETPPAPPPPATYSTEVLLYNGAGVSTSDWQSTESILKNEKISYAKANGTQLGALSVDELASYGAIIIPGGSGGSITSGIATDARIRIRQAVRDRGVGYVGFCAGAWVAVGPEASTDRTASYGLAVAPGIVLDLFMPGGGNPTAAIVDVSFADGSHRDLVWWGGPSTPEWPGGVIARYDTGAPAISETFSGKGLVLVSGPHPEAPQGWRATAGNDPDGLDYALAVKLFRAAITKVELPAF